MKINEKIYTLRKKFGWSQDELADKLSVSRQSVSKWETGDSVPEPAKLLALAKIFSVTTDYLLDDSKEEYISPQTAKNTDTADKVIGKTESLFQNYGWILGVVLLLLGLWRIVSAVSSIATFVSAGAFGILGVAAFLPLIFSLLISLALAVGGIIMIKVLRKKKDETDTNEESGKPSKRLPLVITSTVVFLLLAAIAAGFLVEKIHKHKTFDEPPVEMSSVVSMTAGDESVGETADISLTAAS